MNASFGKLLFPGKSPFAAIEFEEDSDGWETMNILAELQSRFEKVLGEFTDDPKPFVAMVKPSQDSQFGDYQANCAMPLAKQIGKNPRELALEIASKLEVDDLCEPPEVAGPGFINLTLRNDRLESEINRLVTDERLGIVPAASPKTYVIDYSAPNVAKPMHVGHLRSTVIGAALCNIESCLGHRVIGDNHIGDWGTQFGMIIFGYKNFLDEKAFANSPVAELARLYRLVSQLSEYHATVASLPLLTDRLSQKQAELESAENNADSQDKAAKKTVKKLRSEVSGIQADIESARKKLAAVDDDSHLKQLAESHANIAEQARNETAKLHAGDAENRGLWEKFVPACLEAIQEIYDRLGISFELSLGESHYQPMLSDVVENLSEKGIATESEGALCVFHKDNAAPFIVQKTDGAFTYATTDLATIKYRVEELNADVVLYVVDARQGEHFKLLFDTARRWGFDKTNYRHVSFGTVLGKDRRPFKTRSGDTIGLESLVQEAITKARVIVNENDDARDIPELDEKTRAQVAEIVGIGGIKYADLHHNRESDYIFNFEKMLAMTGDTATYIQYSYARIGGIFRKGEVDRELLKDSQTSIRLSQPEERALGLQLLRYAEDVEAAATDFRPNILTHYLFETANVLSTFYEKCHVLREEDSAIRESRLLLCDLTARILDHGLSLLGIQTCEQM